jgi:ATP-dependent DNA helicase RecG
VQKVEGQAEAIRFYNYPFQAVEEALANAVYHKNYEEREPIEVNVRHDRIEILSHGGAMPPITQDDFKKEVIVSRKYLNRRIGDFLKELHLTEGKGTGIPKIRRAMRNNGSDEPIFEMDDARSYFLTILNERKNEKENIVATDRLRPIATDYDRLRPITDAYGQLAEDEEKIMLYLLKNKTINRKETVEILSYGETKIKELFNNMIDKKLIARVGQGRSTHYILGDMPHDK